MFTSRVPRLVLNQLFVSNIVGDMKQRESCHNTAVRLNIYTHGDEFRGKYASDEIIFQQDSCWDCWTRQTKSYGAYWEEITTEIR
jgi:hypothetical protein